ncbi:MAG: Gluconate 5-dehydrogenase [Luteibacter sp.]|uniref:SDR family oxidoreductase n=1 Tax=Luteibacter sp. TaxID=1886636 RepID=UPI001380BEC1|nr:SDR family oxidoreductase [Luteibacter sp.]KAF1004568.1 MAG: Gluconate 5-dehydrogenase [Luteibacter sp.]
MSSQHIVVVGGSSGIGLETTKHLVGAGHSVTMIGRSKARLDSALNATNGQASAVQMDATDEAALADGFAGLAPIDHMVLALGSSKGVGPFGSIALSNIKAGFEEKVYAHIACAQAALPYIHANGSLIFVSGLAAQTATPGTAGIAAANAAVAALVPVLAVELAPIRVNGVSPGVIDTPWWDVVPEEHKQALFAEYAAKTPVGRVGRAKDIAQAIAFLIGNSFVNGHMLTCDGGLRHTA